jgi:hypothetical protein
LAEAEDVEIPVLEKLANLYACSGDFESAEKWFKQAIERVGADVGPLAGRLRIRLGIVMFRRQHYQDAIPLLESGWSLAGRSSDSNDTFLAFWVLAKSYEVTGGTREARSAYEAVLASDPANSDAWAARARIKLNTGPNTQPPLGAAVPAPPALKEFTDIINLGDPLKWSVGELERGLATYEQYAKALEHSGRQWSSWRVRQAAVVAATRWCDQSPSDDPSMDCFKSVVLLEQVWPIGNLDIDSQRMVYESLVAAHTRSEQYVHALDSMERLIGLPTTGEEVKENADRLNSFLLSVFLSVSWNMKTGQLREGDPDDFVELYCGRRISTAQKPPRGAIGGGHSRTKRLAGRPPTSSAALEARAPYGMASPNEDFATIGDCVKVFGEDFREVILLRIRQKNFELPVKVLLHQLATRLSPLTTGINDSYVDALDSAIRKGSGDVSDSTLEAYAVARRILEVFRAAERLSPRPPLTEHPPKK